MKTKSKNMTFHFKIDLNIFQKLKEKMSHRLSYFSVHHNSLKSSANLSKTRVTAHCESAQVSAKIEVSENSI